MILAAVATSSSSMGMSLYSDESLFEGAAIVAEVAGRSCEGHIASVAENRITISLREDLGSEIEFCVLRIDNTAMIEALRKRLEEIAKGEVTNFNSDIASAVIKNTGAMPCSGKP